MQVGNQGYHVLESEMLAELINQRAPWFTSSIGRFRWRMIVRFEKRLAESFGKDRVWLAGDAGHLTGPIGMQSMNIGIHEGYTLANILADIIEGKESASALASYNTERQREWGSLIGLNLSLVEEGDTNAFIATYVDRLLGCLPCTIDSLQAFASALGVEMRAL